MERTLLSKSADLSKFCGRFFSNFVCFSESPNFNKKTWTALRKIARKNIYPGALLTYVKRSDGILLRIVKLFLQI